MVYCFTFAPVFSIWSFHSLRRHLHNPSERHHWLWPTRYRRSFIKFVFQILPSVLTILHPILLALGSMSDLYSNSFVARERPNFIQLYWPFLCFNVSQIQPSRESLLSNKTIIAGTINFVFRYNFANEPSNLTLSFEHYEHYWTLLGNQNKNLILYTRLYHLMFGIWIADYTTVHCLMSSLTP